MSFWDRLTGKLVEAARLGQKKRAAATGILAFDGPLGDLRLEIAIKSHPWLQDAATSTLFLSTWAAQALQDMAAVLESAAQQHLGETGKVPEATFSLADHLYDSALGWIDLAQTALATIEAKSDFVLQLRLPAPAPRLDWVADAPPAHFVAAIQAVVQLATSTEEALNSMQSDRSRLPRTYDGAFESITGTIRFARAKLDQVEAAESDRQAVRLSRDIWGMLQEVVRLYFLAGQQAAMPGLIDRKYDALARADARARRLPPAPTPQPARGSGPRTTAQASSPPPPPRQPPPAPPAPPTLSERLGLRFDAWSLTDPGAKSTYQNDRGRIAELEAFWRADTNPDETFRLFSLITAAIKADHVAARPGEFARACPWISTFVARNDVTIGTEHFTTGQLFTLKVGLDGAYFGRGFDRLGFLPGTQAARPAPTSGAAAGSPAQRTLSDEQMWRLTAAFQRPQRRANRADVDRLRQLWRDDPDPASTLAVHAEIIAALHAGNVRQNGDEGLRTCPWSQVYVAINGVTISGVRLERNEKFALEVGMVAGTFRRAISRLGSIKSASVGGG